MYNTLSINWVSKYNIPAAENQSSIQIHSSAMMLRNTTSITSNIPV